jgi:fatty acid desaturase
MCAFDKVVLHRASYYARDLRSALPVKAFAPARTRLLWLPVHVGVIVLATSLITAGRVHWGLVPVLSLAIGAAFAGTTFLAHETLHGAVVRNQGLRHLIGWIGFLPFVVSPRLWVAWHNRIHHGNANRAGLDPDANPTLSEYRSSRRIRFVTDYLTLGRQSFTGIIGLLIGFSIQSAQVLSFARRRGFLSTREHRLAIAETALGVLVWTALALTLGPLAFLFVFVLPLVVANTIVMAFIMTNHSLSPLARVNDPLVNALSVTAPRWVEWLTLGFGYHVEHHLFPSMSSRHALLVREAILKRWPGRYQSIPLLGALLALHRTARVYEDETTLIDPRTGRKWPARAAPTHRADEVQAGPPTSPT